MYWETTTYTYDVTQTYYQVLTETSGAATTAYEYGIEWISAVTGGAKEQYLYDGRSSVAAILASPTGGGGGAADGEGQTLRYTPYGEQMNQRADARQSGYAYNGEYFNAETGSINLRARQYEPGMMKFGQEDLLRSELHNIYMYCMNDPMQFADRDGLKSTYSAKQTAMMSAGLNPYYISAKERAMSNAGLNPKYDSFAKSRAIASAGLNPNYVDSAQTASAVANNVVKKTINEFIGTSAYATLTANETAIYAELQSYMGQYKSGKITVHDLRVLALTACRKAYQDVNKGADFKDDANAVSDTILNNAVKGNGLTSVGWAGIEQIEKMLPQHEETVRYVAMRLGDAATVKRTDNKLSGAGWNGGMGYPDVMFNGMIWEIKPDSPYGLYTGKRQIKNYTNDTGYIAGYPIYPESFSYGTGTIYIRNGTGETAGVVFYTYKPNEPFKEKVPVTADEMQEEKVIQPANTAGDYAGAAGKVVGGGILIGLLILDDLLPNGIGQSDNAYIPQLTQMIDEGIRVFG